MSTAPICMTTHSANTTAHPGLVFAAAKRTQEDGKTKKELAKVKKQAKEEKKKDTIRAVASLEKRMAEADDTFDVTLKPQGTSKHQLQCTRSYAQLPLTFESPNNSGSEAAGNDMHDGTETEHNMTEEEVPLKKKAKLGFHNAVQMHLDREVNILKPKDRHQCTDYVEIHNSQDEDDELYKATIKTKVGAKGKGGRTNTPSDQKGQKGPGTDKPNRSHAASLIWSALNTVKISNHDNGIEIAKGGLLDFDEMIGNERDAAIKSPQKSKQRISSTALVKVKDSPKPIIPQTKQCAKPTNNKLPKEWLKDGIWRKRIIPSMFHWAGIQENTWVIPDEHITDALTKICKVLWQLSKWRSSFGSAAIAIVNAFFDGNNDYRDSDTMRQEFATHMLDKLRFVYHHNKGDDKKVEHALMLWSTGGLTIEIIQEARDTKKAIKLPVMINPVTGKQSA
ncbi:hypothetical protein PILCRDRAFT_84589 [Piloderma croceum F 1598]|uniref:Uncharacterized protein n=1 Tax=Piloderma croceum (strain F 1598) TaxID=765440 RepID=A0A0C3CIV1_PILCF|nr:hypothetical protein PILCRDRAFT_84589 [Piloderma croceum F 1598]